MKPYGLCFALALSAVATAPALAQSGETYGAQLEGFDYPYPVKRHDFTSQGKDVSMAYMDVAPTGDANGRTVVLLHGKNFCGATWKGTIEELTKAGYRVIAPDQIGFCASTKPEGYQFSFHQLAANTKGLLDSLNVEKPVIITMPTTTASATMPTRKTGLMLIRGPSKAARATGTTAAAMIGLTSRAVPSSSPLTTSQTRRPLRWYSNAAATARMAGARAGTSARAWRELRK